MRLFSSVLPSASQTATLATSTFPIHSNRARDKNTHWPSRGGLPFVKPLCVFLCLILGGAPALEPGHGEGRSAPGSRGGVGALRGQSPQPAPSLLLSCPPWAQLCQERQGEEVQSLCQEEVKGDGKAIGRGGEGGRGLPWQPERRK